MSCEEVFIQKLRAHGLRLTLQRKLILEVMHDIGEYATAEEIYQRVQAQNAAVDITTVYRTLELLQGLNLAASLDLGGGQRRYELVGLHGPHHHLHCRCCGRLIRVEQEEVQPLIEALRQTRGFELTLDHLVLTGLCARCRTAEGQTPAA